MVWLFLRPKYCLENVEHSISKHLNFKIFWGACPQTPLGSSRLPHSKSRLPPTFPVGTSTSKLIDSTDYESKVSCPRTQHTVPSQGSLTPESSTLTMRPLRNPYVLYLEKLINQPTVAPLKSLKSTNKTKILTKLMRWVAHTFCLRLW